MILVSVRTGLSLQFSDTIMQSPDDGVALHHRLTGYQALAWITAALVLGGYACGVNSRSAQEGSAEHSAFGSPEATGTGTAATSARQSTSDPLNEAAPTFASYEDAMMYARRGNCEDADMTNSSVVREAQYCTRGGRANGYLIVNLNGRLYIHAGVPVDVWSAFKSAESSGRFYNSNIRGRYRLNLVGG